MFYKFALRACTLLCFLFILSNASAQTNSPSRYQQAKDDANKHTVTIIGGGISGTYIRFATDMANVLNVKKKLGLRIVPVIGLGGGQNVKDILFLKGIDMGIVQSEHLAYLKKQDPVLYSNIEDRVRYITKLYNSEWHVLARKDIKSLKDLEGKIVNLWKPVSATGIGGRTIFDIVGINIKPVYIDTQLGIEKVKSGEIAATTLLAGAPIKGYTALDDPDLHFVPVDLSAYGALLDTFLPAQIGHAQYPNLIPEGQKIQTIASSALLAVYNWPSDSFRYRKLQSFVERFFNNIDKFKIAPRHPKWKSINLAAKVPGWKRFTPAQNLLSQSRTSSASSVEEKLRKFLENNPNLKWESMTNEERSATFKEFLKWMNKQ